MRTCMNMCVHACVRSHARMSYFFPLETLRTLNLQSRSRPLGQNVTPLFVMIFNVDEGFYLPV